MDYYLSRIVPLPFDEAVEAVVAALATEGFGVLTDVDVRATLEKKLGIAFRPYRILGACNAKFAHEALVTENKIGVMLPCSVIVQENDDGTVEAAAIDPSVAMSGVGNRALGELAGEVGAMLARVLERAAGAAKE